jgi:hypothetical protein
VLFTLAVMAIVVDLTVRLLTRRGGSSPGLSRLHRAVRLVAPLSLVGAGLMLAALSLGSADSEAPSSAGPAPTAEPSDPVLITGHGIGVARVGMSRADVRAALPEGHLLGTGTASYMVDVTGIPVTAAGDTLYMLLYRPGAPDHDDAPITLLATTSPRARTAEDIGPGTSLAEARVRYGPPTLSLDPMDESREYARFPEQPGKGMRFRVSGSGGGLAGSYTPTGETGETTVYDPGARITMVVVPLQP